MPGKRDGLELILVKYLILKKENEDLKREIENRNNIIRASVSKRNGFDDKNILNKNFSKKKNRSKLK